MTTECDCDACLDLDVLDELDPDFGVLTITPNPRYL